MDRERPPYGLPDSGEPRSQKSGRNGPADPRASGYDRDGANPKSPQGANNEPPSGGWGGREAGGGGASSGGYRPHDPPGLNGPPGAEEPPPRSRDWRTLAERKSTEQTQDWRSGVRPQNSAGAPAAGAGRESGSAWPNDTRGQPGSASGGRERNWQGGERDYGRPPRGDRLQRQQPFGDDRLGAPPPASGRPAYGERRNDPAERGPGAYGNGQMGHGQPGHGQPGYGKPDPDHGGAPAYGNGQAAYGAEYGGEAPPFDPARQDAYGEHGEPGEYDAHAQYEGEYDEVHAGAFDDLYEEEASEPKRRRPALLIGILAGVAVIAGALIFGYQWTLGDAADGSVPVVEADKSPAKVAPEDPGGTNIPQQTKLIYDRIVGEEEVKGERVVPREEPVLEIKPDAKDQSSNEAGGSSIESASGGPVSGEQVAISPAGGDGASINEPTTGGSVEPSEPSADSGSPGGPSPVLPFGNDQANNVPVGNAPAGNDVTGGVPPEGSDQASGDRASGDQASGDQIAAIPIPRAKPNLQAARSGQSARASPGASGSGGPLRIGPGSNAAPPPVAPSTADNAPPPAAAPQAPQTLTPQPPRTVTNFGPASQAGAPQAAPQQTASIGGGGDYTVQLAALRSQDEAVERFQVLKQRHGDILGNYNSIIQKVDLPERGVFYRLRVGPIADAQSASSLCENLKSRGEAECIVARR